MVKIDRLFETGGFIMEYILGLIVLVLGFFIIGYFFKKKRYTDIDKLEEWKMNIMNRPVLDEL